MTIALDFDGVIHSYHKGWQKGEIYGYPIDGALESIHTLLRQGHSVVIISTRSPFQIRNWLDMLNAAPAPEIIPFEYQVIPFWKKFWNKKNVVGITRRKIVANIYIDDRAERFDGNWLVTMNHIKGFKTWQEIEKRKGPY